jgi:hypothetical protein
MTALVFHATPVFQVQPFDPFERMVKPSLVKRGLE